MPIRPPDRKPATPSEILTALHLGYNGYTDPRQANPKMWAAAQNIFSGAFGYLQRARFANLSTLTTTFPFTTLKFFALPGLSSYILADVNGLLYSYDTNPNPYTQTQRINYSFDPNGTGTSLLNGPWSREALQNIMYEMNGQVKQAGRGANAATIEGFGLDAPDASPLITISAGASQNITAISRTGNVVTATVSSALTVPGGNGVGMVNVVGVTDGSYNGTFVLQSGSGTTSLTWNQLGQNSSSSGGAVNTNITKAVGRSYAYAWENANKVHVGAPSPVTQYILFSNQNATIQPSEPGTVAVSLNGTVVTGTGTQFTSAWIGKSIIIDGGGLLGFRAGGTGAIPDVNAVVISVQSTTQLTIRAGSNIALSGKAFCIVDLQSTHVRLYATSDGGATYFRIQRNALNYTQASLSAFGLQFFDNANSEPPAFPFLSEVAQVNNVPPPIGAFLNEYQGRLIVYGVAGAPASFFYSNQEATTIGQPQESYAPLNQVSLPIQNAKMNGMLEFPGSAIIWSDKQDMFRLTGLLTDNVVGNIAAQQTATQQGATIARLPYNLGCASPFAAEITPLGGIWLTPNAEIWLYTDRYAPRNIGRPVQDILSTINPANINLARARYYHNGTRNWFVLAIPANGASFNNTVLILDLDLLASNGSPSYFTFDMATNSPSWFVYSVRSDSLEVVYENSGGIRLITGQIGLLQDIDFGGGPNGGFGTEQVVTAPSVTLHAWGNDSAQLLKRPGWLRFLTNRDPSMLASDGWSFQALGIDDDFYTFANPLKLTLTPGANDASSLGGNPSLVGGAPFRHSPALFRIGGVNFVMGRRIQFVINFPTAPGVYRFSGLEIGFGALPPS